MDSIVNTIMRSQETNAFVIAKNVYNACKNKPGDTKEMVEQVLITIARGPDNVSGTQDDLIPQQTLDHILQLLRNGLVSDFVEYLSSKKKWFPCCQ
jgi:hypothetical protein